MGTGEERLARPSEVRKRLGVRGCGGGRGGLGGTRHKPGGLWQEQFLDPKGGSESQKA